MLHLFTQGPNLIPVCNKLAAAIKEVGGEAKVSTNLQGVSPKDTVLRWGTLEPAGARAQELNKVEAVTLARNKIASRKKLGALAVPTFFTPDQVKEFPVVLRPSKHHGGKNLFVLKNRAEFLARVKNLPRWYASPLMKKVREFRIFVLGNHVTSVSERFPDPADPNKVAWNLQAGGKLINCRFKDWPIELCQKAVQATKEFGLDFSAIDGMIDPDGKSYIFEVNTAPGLKNPYTLDCLATSLVYQLKNGVAPATPIKDVKKITWKTLRHPALLDRDDANGVAAVAKAPQAAAKPAFKVEINNVGPLQPGQKLGVLEPAPAAKVAEVKVAAPPVAPKIAAPPAPKAEPKPAAPPEAPKVKAAKPKPKPQYYGEASNLIAEAIKVLKDQPATAIMLDHLLAAKAIADKRKG